MLLVQLLQVYDLEGTVTKVSGLEGVFHLFQGLASSLSEPKV